MKNLCDDIYISYRTFGTKFGAMYNAARQTSQGTQRLYTVSHTPDEETEDLRLLRRPRLTRQTNAPRTLNLYSNGLPSPFPNLCDDLTQVGNHFDDMSHVLSNFEDSPYLTPSATQVMREISVGTTCDLFAQSKNYSSDEEQIEEAN
jgi:hypothetical protein